MLWPQCSLTRITVCYVRPLREVISARLKHARHTNSDIFILSETEWDSVGVKDVTEQLRKALAEP